ncbi:DsbE family thiol:disulfide interchange protein [Devosia algicola]|uniref:DsbE family thiol:disulfide interchange protein n=1 Tax=Devosia algicola TaxID=3026418 RepID=A0ABY7YK72_9HYPH|nr:DsbE family thiol:disulfide interchange protein [Devosia algicola]WDR01694.1 DsbE family thiol:disulfide interchange protein [Devosia algicola]
MRYVFFALPLLVLVGLLAVFAASIDRDPNLVRSVLIDKPAPEFSMPAVAGLGVPGFDTESLKGAVTVVNVFASWCVPCREEHPILSALKDVSGVQLFGINQADKPENAVAFLEELGNPYDRVGADDNRRVSIDWGVYGVPETFIVDTRGVITFKHVGPMSGTDVENVILPAIEKARAVKP